jgi:chloramphenicol-sensitive protein RarD
VSLGLALSFGVYGLVRKTAQLGAAEGLTLETLLISAVCIPVLGWQLAGGTEAFAVAQPSVRALLMLAGPATAIPLLLFAMGARRVSLGTLGFLQYLSPSLQFALGVFVYGEPFDASRAIGFGFIWAALALYSIEGLLATRTPAR